MVLTCSYLDPYSSKSYLILSSELLISNLTSLNIKIDFKNKFNQ